MKYAIFAAATILTASTAFAGGEHKHSHGHDDGHIHETVQSAGKHGHTEGHDHATGHMEMMAVGMPGEKGKATRTVEVEMYETDDGEMLFEPSELSFSKGETIIFAIKNKGELDHEFVIDTYANNMEHRDLMMKFPEMEHDDPNSVTLAPGETGEIAWTFANSGYFHFACLIPGHMESGMHGPIKVSNED